jgi:hypothetical protein
MYTVIMNDQGFVMWVGKAPTDEDAFAAYAADAQLPNDRAVSGDWENECIVRHVEAQDMPEVEAWIAAGHPSGEIPECLR